MAKKADKAKMVALPGSSHPIPVGSKAVRQTSGQRWLELTVGVRPIKPLSDLSALDHKLPADRTYMTREQLADQHGSDPKAVEAIEAFAKAHNLVVTRNESASARMGLAGTVEDVNAATVTAIMCGTLKKCERDRKREAKKRELRRKAKADSQPLETGCDFRSH